MQRRALMAARAARASARPGVAQAIAADIRTIARFATGGATCLLARRRQLVLVRACQARLLVDDGSIADAHASPAREAPTVEAAAVIPTTQQKVTL